MQEKAASQWTKEEIRGDTRGAAGGKTCDCILRLQTFEYLEEVGGRAGQPGKEGQRQPSGGQTYLPVLLVNYF